MTFKFRKGALGVTDFNQVRQVVERIFKLPGEEPTATLPQTTPAPPQSASPTQGQQRILDPGPPADSESAPIAPPPPPPIAPRKLELGQSIDQVVGTFGTPQAIVNSGADVIYKYKDFKVTFQAGKVAGVD